MANYRLGGLGGALAIGLLTFSGCGAEKASTQPAEDTSHFSASYKTSTKGSSGKEKPVKITFSGSRGNAGQIFVSGYSVKVSGEHDWLRSRSSDKANLTQHSKTEIYMFSPIDIQPVANIVYGCWNNDFGPMQNWIAFGEDGEPFQKQKGCGKLTAEQMKQKREEVYALLIEAVKNTVAKQSAIPRK